MFLLLVRRAMYHQRKTIVLHVKGSCPGTERLRDSWVRFPTPSRSTTAASTSSIDHGSIADDLTVEAQLG